MIGAIRALIAARATGRVVVVLGILAAIVGYLNVNAPLGIAQVEADSGGVGVLDTASYDAAGVYQTLQEMGEAGRASYQRLLLTTELAFPLFYRLFGVTLLTYALGRLLPPSSRWQNLALLPFVGMVADYVENASVLTMLLNYPERLLAFADIASVATRVKWLSNYVDWSLMTFNLLGLLFVFLRGKLLSRKESPARDGRVAR